MSSPVGRHPAGGAGRVIDPEGSGGERSWWWISRLAVTIEASSIDEVDRLLGTYERPVRGLRHDPQSPYGPSIGP